MAKSNTTFRDNLHRAQPALADRKRKNSRKRAIAIKLRALRDARGMTQGEVAAAAGMTQSMIARLEALSGSVPSLESIERYVEACRSHLALLIVDDEPINQDGFANAFAQARGCAPSDLALSVGTDASISSVKRRVEIEVDADLLAEAEGLEVDLSYALEAALRGEVKHQNTARALAEAADQTDQDLATDDLLHHQQSRKPASGIKGKES